MAHIIFQHPMWQAWDLALDLCLAQLPAILESEDQFIHSPFFEEQLTAFQVWLALGSEQRNPPEQLPIVLQVQYQYSEIYSAGLPPDKVKSARYPRIVIWQREKKIAFPVFSYSII